MSDIKDITLQKLEKNIRDIKLELSFREYILQEAKQVGNIYHFTTLSNVEKILDSKKIKKGREQYVSLTRDFQLPNNTGYFNTGEYMVRITLDGDKMSENIKFYPINDNQYNDEREEGVLNDISTKYIKQIDILTKDNRVFSYNIINTIFNELSLKYSKENINIVKKWIPVK